MTEILKRLKGTGTPVAVYYKSSGGFCAGFVHEADDEFVLMEFISPAGRFDGVHCIRIEEILKVDAGTKYLFNLVKVYRHYGEEIPALKVSPKNVLENFIDFVIKSKRLCTMEIGFETLDKISGYAVGRDWNILEMRLLDEDGKADGYTRLDLEEIVYLGVDSEYEKYLALLSGLNGGVSPDGGEDGGKRGKKTGDKHILSFPFGK